MRYNWNRVHTLPFPTLYYCKQSATRPIYTTRDKWKYTNFSLLNWQNVYKATMLVYKKCDLPHLCYMRAPHGSHRNYKFQNETFMKIMLRIRPGEKGWLTKARSCHRKRTILMEHRSSYRCKLLLAVWPGECTRTRKLPQHPIIQPSNERMDW